MTINGIAIPKGMIINAHIYTVHYDPEYWPEPEKYNPERYVGESGPCSIDILIHT